MGPREGLQLKPVPRGLVVESLEGTDAFVISLGGEMDVTNVEGFRCAIRRAEQSPSPVIVIDASALAFIDSCGVREIVGLHRRALDVGRRVLLLPGPPKVHQVFEACGLSDAFMFVE
jgi:anti-anti-sigma factor